MKPLWQITGLGRHGTVVVLIAAWGYGEALQRFNLRHRNVRIVSVVKQDFFGNVQLSPAATAGQAA
jgi:hypothetical protein